MRVFAPEPDRDHIDEAFDRTLPIVFGHPMDARMMRDFDLRHAEPIERQECRHEAVHLAEEVDLLEAFPLVRLEAAAGIMDTILHKHTPEQVGCAREEAFHKRILALEPPARYHIVALIHLGQEERDISRIILQVSVERDDDLTRRGLDTCIKRRRLTEVLAERHQAQR